MINHINKKNNPQIVNISQKQITERVAKAEATISFDKITFNKIKQMKTKKGSLNSTAILAGIMGAKETSRLIPLCHNIPINFINIDIKRDNKSSSLKIISEVKTLAKVGVLPKITPYILKFQWIILAPIAAIVGMSKIKIEP